VGIIRKENKMKEVIAYKIVTKERKSGFIAETPNHEKINGDFILHYPVNSTVKAKEGTLGIFAFATKKDAMHYVFHTNSRHIIIKIKGIPKPKKEYTEIISYADNPLSDFYEKLKNNLYSYHSDGYKTQQMWPETILFDSVEVLN
jgi:hypothetical protein